MRERIVKQRDIIDRRRIAAELGAIARDPKRKDPARRAAVLAGLKTALKTGRDEVRRRFEAGASGAQTVHAHCFLTDQLVRLIYDYADRHAYPLPTRTEQDRMSVVAVGGYGRGDMAPQSDVDILFLFPYKQTPHGEQVVEYMLYMLWDLGLKVGHATRSVEDCLRLARQDMTIRTNLLENRYVWGDQALYKLFRARFLDELVTGSGREFIEAKLAERDARHERMGDSRYVVEPNVKDGKGGLRDLHTLFWIAKYLYQVPGPAALVERGVLTAREAKHFAKAQNFLWTVRCWLHYIAGRPEERLTFDMQREIAARAGYTDHPGTSGVERFMKHYYLYAKQVGSLTRIFCAALEAQHQRRPFFRLPQLARVRRTAEGFALRHGRLALNGPEDLRNDPTRLLSIFLAAHEQGIDIHPESLHWVTRNLRLITEELRQDRRANQVFMNMLCHADHPDLALRALNEAGVFGRFLPDFGRVVAQMQYDMYHTYTVDEHTIRAIGILNRIERGDLTDEAPLASGLIHKILSREVLYVAVLLHDIAKGRGGDHSELGAEVALKLGPRLGLSPDQTETVAWLVRAHLWMSQIAFKRDLSDPQTIADFADRVQSLENLRLLLILTVADIRAVGPNVWNNWKAALLRALYHATAERLTAGLDALPGDHRVNAAQEALRGALAGWSDEDIDGFIAHGYPSYWLAFDTDTHRRHAELIRRASRDGAPITVDWRVDKAHGVTEVVVYTQDHPGLFSQIAGAMALAGASIVDAKILTMTDGMALDTFWIQDAGHEAFAQSAKLAKLASFINQIVRGEVRPLQELRKRAQSCLPSRTDVFTVKPRVLIDNKASRTHTVIEIAARDRRGLLYDVTRELNELSLQIGSARIATYGEKAVDVFYVKDVFGLKIDSRTKFHQIRDRLTQVLSDAPAEAAQ